MRIEVLEYLNSKCNKWIGCRGTIKWPADLPDLTPCDFLLWDIVKELVYSSKPQNLHELKINIQAAFDKFNENKPLLLKICD